MRRLRNLGAVALAAGLLSMPASPGAGQTENLPPFIATPLSHLQQVGIDTEAIGERPAVDFFGIGDLDSTCPGNAQFMREAAGVALLTVYYGQAHGIFTGALAPGSPGPWGIANMLGAPEGMTTAGDLLKTVDDEMIALALDLGIAALSDVEAGAIAAAIDGVMARYDPVMQALESDPDLLRRAMDTLRAGVYLNYDVDGPAPATALMDLGFAPVGGPCYQHVFYRYLRVGETVTYTCHVTLDFVYQSFWIRRAAEGTQHYTRALLEMAADRLAARADVPPENDTVGRKG